MEWFEKNMVFKYWLKKLRLKEDVQASSENEGNKDRDKKHQCQSMFMKIMSDKSEQK